MGRLILFDGLAAEDFIDKRDFDEVFLCNNGMEPRHYMEILLHTIRHPEKYFAVAHSWYVNSNCSEVDRRMLDRVALLQNPGIVVGGESLPENYYQFHPNLDADGRSILTDIRQWAGTIIPAAPPRFNHVGCKKPMVWVVGDFKATTCADNLYLQPHATSFCATDWIYRFTGLLCKQPVSEWMLAWTSSNNAGKLPPGAKVVVFNEYDEMMVRREAPGCQIRKLPYDLSNPEKYPNLVW